MQDLDKSNIYIVSIVAIVAIVALVIFFFGQGQAKSSIEGEDLTGQSWSALSTEQIKFYRNCIYYEDKCTDLLKNGDQAGYTACWQNCKAKAQNFNGHDEEYCIDYDDGIDYYTSSFINTTPKIQDYFDDVNELKTYLYDTCKEFSNGKEYLIERKCKGDKPSYVQKNCAELGKNYVCEEGRCKEEVLLELNIGDTIESGEFSLRLAYIYDNEDLGKGAMFTLFQENGGSILHHPLSPVRLSIYNQYEVTPYLKRDGLIEGLYLVLVDVDVTKNVALVRQFNSCSDLVDYCLEDPLSGENEDFCHGYCVYESLEGEVSYSKGHFVGHAPVEFQNLNEYIIDSLDLCYEKIENYTDLEPEAEKIHFKLFVGDGLSGGLGSRYDSITYESSNENYLYDEQQRINEQVGGWGEYAKDLEAGICPTNSAQGHELVHIFVAGTPIGIGYCAQGSVCGAFNEGLAEYLKYKINDYQMTGGSYQEVICEEEGFVFSWSPETLHSYYDFSSDASGEMVALYSTGLCLWDYIEDNYGHGVFLQILNKLDEYRNLPGEFGSYTYKGYDLEYSYNILTDFIFPFTGEDVLLVLEDRFGVSIDNSYISIPRKLEKDFFE